MFTTMWPEEQQTSNDLIVTEGNCFIIEIFDKCSFSGILRGCLNHLSKPNKNKHLPDNRYCEINYDS